MLRLLRRKCGISRRGEFGCQDASRSRMKISSLQSRQKYLCGAFIVVSYEGGSPCRRAGEHGISMYSDAEHLGFLLGNSEERLPFDASRLCFAEE